MDMEQDQLRRRVNEVAQYAEDAKRASYGNAVPAEVRECVDKMYWQARQAREACTAAPQQQQQSAGPDTVRSLVEELEQLGDRAVAACQASGNVDPPLQQAVQRAHEEFSRLKQQMQ
ncbi:hypothetical protein [Azohydromonas australica]|uniref:hypothetical protein n=1 Tax=Azohydromonas australica TaxID=364039 RepID=UPI0003FEC78C|nr:hypothetical protein [Azohydromonas australica]